MYTWQLNDSFIKLNCRGIKFTILIDKLKNYPLESQLYQLTQSSNREFYFDRDPFILNSILNYSTLNKLHLDSNNNCIRHVVNEYNFWFNSSHPNEYQHLFDSCCKIKLNQLNQDLQDELEFQAKILQQHKMKTEQVDYGTILPKLREYLWNLFDNPKSSYFAFLFLMFSQLVLIASTVNLILVSFEDHLKLNHFKNQTNETVGLIQNRPYLGYFELYKLIETICFSWFTFEFLLRFLTCPFKMKFLKNFFNLIDLLTIVLFYIFLIVNVVNGKELPIALIRYGTQMIRIILLFKITKLSSYMESLGITIGNSIREIGILFTYLFISILIFSSFVFYSEMEFMKSESDFKSIPATFWWAIVTMTTVGYGDLVPQSALAKVIASFAAIVGIFIVALPVAVITNNFAEFHKNQKKKKLILDISQDENYIID